LLAAKKRLRDSFSKNLISCLQTFYTDEVIGKLNFIKDAKETGFTLAEIKEVIDAWYGNKMTRKEKIAVFDKKLQQLDDKIKELRNLKKQIAICKDDINEGRE
jgi:MerR family transcriptional regulator, copper efflux regulator